MSGADGVLLLYICIVATIISSQTRAEDEIYIYKYGLSFG